MRSGGLRRAHLVLLGCDLAALAVAFEAAFRLRPFFNYLFTAQLTPDVLATLVPPLPLVLGCWVAGSAWLRLYRPRRGPWLWNAAVLVGETMVVVVVLTVVITFFLREPGQSFSRSFVVFLAALGVAVMLAIRGLVGLGLALARRRGYGRERLLIVGRGAAAKALIARLERSAGDAVALCGVVTPRAGEAAGVLGNPVPIVGALADLAALINRHRIDRVVAVEKEMTPEDLHAGVAICTRMGIPLSRTAGLLERSATRVDVNEIGNVTLIEVRGLEFTRVQEGLKRAFDLVVAGALLFALTPLLLLFAGLIRLTSRGPALYVAPRAGRGGRHFPFLKFRTMVRDAEARRDRLAPSNEKSGHLFKVKDDPRVTPLGRLMRRFSLDELPQLINVLRGEMSLVGPRPLPAGDLDPDGLSREHRLWALQRTRVPPGITGLWQVRGRSDLSFEEMLRLDIDYVRRWSVWLDVAILVQTIPAVFRRRGAC